MPNILKGTMLFRITFGTESIIYILKWGWTITQNGEVIPSSFYLPNILKGTMLFIITFDTEFNNT